MSSEKRSPRVGDAAALEVDEAVIVPAPRRYQPADWDQARRFVVIRRPVPEEPSAQLALSAQRAVVFADPGPRADLLAGPVAAASVRGMGHGSAASRPAFHAFTSGAHPSA